MDNNDFILGFFYEEVIIVLSWDYLLFSIVDRVQKKLLENGKRVIKPLLLIICILLFEVNKWHKNATKNQI